MPIITKPPLFLSRVKAYQGGIEQDIPSGVYTKVELNTKSYDSQDEFDIAVNFRWTAKTAGFYLFTSLVTWCPMAVGSRICLLLCLNGNNIATDLRRTSGDTHLTNSVTDIRYVDPGDYYEIFVFQDSGADISLYIPDQMTRLAIHKLSEP